MVTGLLCFAGQWSFIKLSAQSPPDKSGVKASAISLPSGPGSIEGLGESFEPQLNTGASTYSVGFQVPPGRAGLQPSLGLSYHSGLGNSCVGIGWSFDLPSITRQTDKGFPEYNESDTFLFQGEELVPLTDGFWRCENESAFIRFRQIDTDGDNRVDAWEATERNGIRHIYGSHRGLAGWSVVEHPDQPVGVGGDFDHTYSWALDTTIDLHGNRIEYRYVLGEGVLFLSTVVYTLHEALPDDAPMHRVVFDYDLDRPDVFDDYRPTFSAKMDRRLTTVKVYTGAKLVRSYQLTYQNAPATDASVSLGVSMLHKVTQYDNTVKDSNFLPPLIFEYSALSWVLDGIEVETLDFDVMPELDLAEPGGSTQIVDLDADGLPDIFKTNMDFPQRQEAVFNQGVDAEGRLRFSAKQTVDPGFSPPDLGQAETTLSDFDGDGVVDFLYLYDEFPGKRMEVFPNRSRLDIRSERLGFEEMPKRLVWDDAPDFVGYGSAKVRQLDLNFDKSSDFVRIYSDFPNAVAEGAYRQANGSWALTTPHRFDSGSMPIDLDFSDRGLRMADMNGDRLQDLVWVRKEGGFPARLTLTYWPYCGLGRWGEARELETSGNDTLQIDELPLEDVFIEDLSGDGLADLFYLEGSGSSSILTIRFNVAGNRWTESLVREGLPRYQPRSTDAPTIFRRADLNGNGSTDLIWRNTAFGDDSWQWIDIMPDAGKPNLLIQIDNSIGKVTEIQYGNAHEDYIRAQDAGHPWKTKVPFAVQVVRQIRTRCGYDLNGDGQEDTYVSAFKYRDGFYDGLEREFRGFAYAERVDYGDDFLWDANLGVIQSASGWNQGLTPTRQVSGPSLVTRYRFHTGAADQQDNDEQPSNGSAGWVDEWTEVGGREEEILKGKQILEEKIDPRILFLGEETDFDTNCAQAETDGFYASITPDAYVYTRVRQKWGVRRLYRPQEAVVMRVDLTADGVLEPEESLSLIPGGRFNSPVVIAGNGRSVSYAFVQSVETDVIEANGLLSDSLGYEKRAKLQTSVMFNYDDYGNAILQRDEGILSADHDDERIVRTTYALSGEAENRWIISLPDTIETMDEAGLFVNRTKHYYDGNAFEGLSSGMVGARGLLHRIEQFIDPNLAINEQRTAYDAFGNAIEMRDPNFGTSFAPSGGHRRTIEYDVDFQTYPVFERIEVSMDQAPLVMGAEYDAGFGVVTLSKDFNGNNTSYEYDRFGRLVAVVKPGDSSDFPTQLYKYQAFDPHRSRVYRYARSGDLSLEQASGESNRVVTYTREVAGTDQVYTTATYTDGCGKSIAEVGEGEMPNTWIVSKASSYNLRGTESAIWLPYQVDSLLVPKFETLWPSGRPPQSDGVLPTVVKSDLYADPLGRPIASLQPPETWGGVRKQSQTHLLPFEKRLFDENDSDPQSPYVATPLVHFEDGLGRLVKVHEVVRLTDEGEAGALSVWETRYTYDLNDKLETITDSQDNLKVMDYDGLGRLTFMDDPDRGVMHYIYDPASNLIETTDAKRQTIRYTYDGVNRIRTEDYLDEGGLHYAQYRFDASVPISAVNRPDVAYFYDHSVPDFEVGDGTRDQGSHTLGQLAYVWDLTGEEHFSYDARARMKWQVKRIPDTILKDVLVAWQTQYEYDSLDRVTRLTYPDGDRITYGYNARNLLEHVVGGPSGYIIQNIDYRPSAQLSKIVYGNDVVTIYDYDPRLRLRDLDTDSPVAGKLIDYAYIFDNASNITRIDDKRDLTDQPEADKRYNTQVFQYDDLYRLTQVKYPSIGAVMEEVTASTPGIDYRYDRIGNMLRKTSNIEHVENGKSVTHLGEMSYGGSLGAKARKGRGNSIAGPHALSSVSADGGRMYPYDANGNMTNIDGLLCSWDFKDRMVAAENDKMSARYHYDYTDRRIIKEVTQKADLAVSGEASEVGPGVPVGTGDNGNPQSTETTQYINKYFELRPGEPPVKYVWSGETRVARITTVLDKKTSKTQRMRLWEGWNLTSVNVDANTSTLAPANNPNIEEAALWHVGENKWDYAVTDAVPQYTPLWLKMKFRSVISLAGSRNEAPSIELKTSQQGWLINTGEGPLQLVSENASLWRWNPEKAAWNFTLTSLFDASDSDHSAFIDSGEVVYGMSQSGGIEEIKQSSEMDIRYYHQDHLGSSDLITDFNGVNLKNMAYFPFGAVRNSLRGSKFDGIYGFTQKEMDGESGLKYFEARYLTSTYSRFTRVDLVRAVELGGVINNPQKMNTYTYCINAPLIFNDPSGCSEKLSKNLYRSENAEVNFKGDFDALELSLKGGVGGEALGVEATAISTESELSFSYSKGLEFCQKTEMGAFKGGKSSFTTAKHVYCNNLKTGKSKNTVSFFESSRTIEGKECQSIGPVKICAKSKAKVSVAPFKLNHNKSGANYCGTIKVEGMAGLSVKGQGTGWFIESEMRVKGSAALEICVKK